MSANICSGKSFNILFSFFLSRTQTDLARKGLYLYVRSAYDLPVRDRCLLCEDHRYNAHTLICALVRENYFSVNTRYHRADPVDLPDLHPTPYPWTLAEVAWVIKDIEYQSCESDDYYGSLAYQVLTLAKNEVLSFICERAAVGDASAAGMKIAEGS